MKKIVILLFVFTLLISFVYAAGSGGGGDSGGGGGGGGGSDTPVFRFLSNQNTLEKTLDRSKDYIISLDNNKYTFFVKKIEGESITLLIKTEPEKEFLIVKGENKKIDLDNDGVNDISIEVKSITGRKVNIVFMKETAQGNEKEEDLLCGDKNTRRERVKCRLNLEKEELEDEYTLQFLPEECKALEGEKRADCITTYKNVQPCWKFKEGSERVSCVKEKINFRGVSEERRICNELKDEAKRACVENFKENLFTVIKFRFYNLEERAEEYLEEGKVSEEDVVVFVDALEGKKVEFNDASLDRKKEIVLEVKTLWQDFKVKLA